MSLRPSELAQVAEELNRELAGAFVQKAYAPHERLCFLELRQVGRSTTICLSIEPGAARVSVAERPPASGEQHPLQRVLRQRLVGARLTRVEAIGSAVALIFDLKGSEEALIASLGAPARLSVSKPPDLRPPATEPASPPSRLVPVDGAALPYAEAAERLFAKVGRDQAQRRALAPLDSKRSRLRRTIEKVRAEAERMPLAEEHRRFGELLSQNLHRVQKGAKSVPLTEYGPGGVREVEVPLDPRRSPKEEVAWRFKQYKRLARGTELARERLSKLEGELRALDARISEVQQGQSVAAAQPEPSRPVGKVTARPFREYLSSGHRIWVGKDARSNDALTFRFAKPHHLWLHARGVPGAHVVIPLEKKEVLAQEVLLDAAHLAAHHSEAKGEPRAEVAYTQVKHVRRVKGGAPGQVTYSQEKTFTVRVEPSRLERLLRSAEASE